MAGRRNFDASALPPRRQLALHVEAEAFAWLVPLARLFADLQERIAEAVHEE